MRLLRTRKPSVRPLLGNVLPHTRPTFAAGSALGGLSRAALPGSHQLLTVESKGTPGLDSRPFMRAMSRLRCTVNYCKYGWNRWKSTSIWTNVRTWMPEPRCLSKPHSCCDHFRENGKHLDRVQTADSNSPSFAALPEMLVLSWTMAALTEIGLEVTTLFPAQEE